MKFLSKQPYSDFRSRLYRTSRRDFEHECLKVLRVVHDDLQRVVESKTLDCAGLDLIQYGEEGRSIEIGIQCKGFEVPDFRSGQRRQCLDSVETLRASGIRIRHYLLALNRHLDREIDRDAVSAALHALVKEGVCETARWLDPGALVQYAAEKVQAQAEALIDEANRLAREEHADRLGQGFYLSDVPFTIGSIHDFNPGRYLEALIGGVRAKRDAMAAEMDVDPGALSLKSIWAFVVGEFGFGKTSLLLGLSDHEVGFPIYLPIARFEADAFANETSLVRSILGVVRERPYDHDRLEDRFLVANLRTTLKARSDLVLLIDGLDEHPVLYTSWGIERVFKCFADVGAPCVFSARAEFWKDRSGDLTAALGSNQSRKIVIEMEDWSREEILTFVREHSRTSATAGLTAFEAIVVEDRFEEVYGDIPRRPLFLRMLVEDAERGETVVRSLAELYERYLVRKFVRDREGSTKRAVVSRPLSTTFSGDRLSQAGKILRVLDRVAAEMIETGPGWEPGVEQVAGLQLATDVCESTVEVAVEEEGLALGETLELLQHSVLVPMSARTLDGMRLRFAHRSFQEFFFARSILRGFSPESYAALMGTSVRRFVDEFRVMNRDWR